jgi:hypothetical protein
MLGRLERRLHSSMAIRKGNHISLFRSVNGSKKSDSCLGGKATRAPTTKNVFATKPFIGKVNGHFLSLQEHHIWA